MKINNEQRVVETDGFDNKPTQFTIKQNARAFEILSSNIYSDKILAVVREYGTNALDAHVMADCVDKPFEVHLPNTFEPWFSIRDFGPGLSHDDVTKLYTTYFHSTKDNSNDTTGCLGLGSKSGFAYTDQFTITSRFDGVKRTYSAYVDESGAPAITKLTEDKTDDANGMEIYMPVKTTDFTQFADRATKVFHRFPTLPTITGNKADLTKVEYLLQGPNYKIRKFDERYHYRGAHSGAYAVQGAVAYPIEVSSISDMPSELYQLVKNCPVDIIFPIGKVNITASRERLNYDKQTQQNIIDAVQAVYDHIPTHFVNTLSSAKTLYEAKEMYAKWLDTNNSDFLRSIVKDKLLWNGQKIVSTYLPYELFDMVQACDVLTNAPLTVTDPITKVSSPLMEKSPWGSVSIYEHNSLHHDKSVPEREVYGKFWVDPKHIIVFEDAKMKSPNQIIRHNYRGKDVSKVYLLRCDATRLPQVLKQLGDMPISKLVMGSTLEVPPPEVRATLKADVKKLWKLRGFTNWGSYTDVETSHDMATGGFYVMSYDGTLISPGKENDIPNNVAGASAMLGALETLGYMKDTTGAPTEIFRVNSSHRTAVFNNPAWVSIYSLVEPRIRYWTDDKTKRDVIKSLITLVEIGNNSIYQEFMCFYQNYKVVDSPQYFKQNSRMKKLIEEVDAMVVQVTPMLGLKPSDNMNSLLAHGKIWLSMVKYSHEMFGTEDFSQGLFREKIKTDTLQKMKKVLDFYPCFFKMSDNMSSHDLRFSVKDVSHYIDLCDTNQKRVKDFYTTT